MVAFVSISAGYDASPSLTTTDVLLSSITTAAAGTIDSSVVVTPLANYFFSLASSVLISLTITVVVEKVLSKRPDLEADASDEPAGSVADLRISTRERRALRLAGITALLFLAAMAASLIPAGSPSAEKRAEC
ncbi:AbgT family transporter [Arthrobacter sp. ATA002]|nr:AbgT family transporter [Arthrobacter sp. ATA002]